MHTARALTFPLRYDAGSSVCSERVRDAATTRMIYRFHLFIIRTMMHCCGLV